MPSTCAGRTFYRVLSLPKIFQVGRNLVANASAAPKGATDAEALVALAYRAVLRREPDPGGLATYAGALRGGRDMAWLVEELSSSEEFRDSVEAAQRALPQPSAEPPTDPRADTFDPVELQRKVRAILRLLRPYAAAGVGKVRLGRLGDGGYVHLDDFSGIDAALSLGINDDISWDLDAAARGMTVYQFDHTVNDPAPGDPRMVFERKMIGPVSGPDTRSLAELVRQHDRGAERPNMVLKMDIELHEWDVINATDPALLGRFAQIACELHYFQGLNQMDWRQRIYDALSRLHGHYAVVHVHANTVGGTSVLANTFVPNVLEVTFANRGLYRFQETGELFPGPLDQTCYPGHPDIFLGSFRY